VAARKTTTKRAATVKKRTTPAKKGTPAAKKRPPAAKKRPTAAKKASPSENKRSRTVTKSTAGKTSGAAVADSLDVYNAKRDFQKTAEPAGRRAKTTSELRFVIQKHAASHLHFDFRLELDGVMKSWAVPKGPSYDPTVKRLAMQVEDHPIEYNTFEGTIPKGQYGGGTVMIWDRGTYEAQSGDGVDAVRDGYKRGDLKIIMHGERMQGSWVLVRTRRDDRGKAQWLLIKHRDHLAMEGVDIVAAVQTSVVSGRTMEEIAKGDTVWQSNRTARR
jgi:bifunctional non-homologous end joining protein LigD